MRGLMWSAPSHCSEADPTVGPNPKGPSELPDACPRSSGPASPQSIPPIKTTLDRRKGAHRPSSPRVAA